MVQSKRPLHSWACFVLVVGEKERENQTVNVRTRDNKVHGEFAVDAVIPKFETLVKERTINSEEHFILI